MTKELSRLKTAAPSFTIKDNKLAPNHAEPAVGYVMLQEALGSADGDFTMGLVAQLANVNPHGSKEQALNFLVSVAKSIKPRDQIEAMLAAQMAVVHVAIMTLGKRLLAADNVPQQDSAERALNKLTRTYATQMEALKRYRDFGDQTSAATGAATIDGADQAAKDKNGESLSQPQVPSENVAKASAPSQADRGEEAAPKVVPMKRGSGSR